MDAEASRVSDSDVPSAGDRSRPADLPAALGTIENWLRAVIDDPEGDAAGALSARLSELAQDFPASIGEGLESIAALIAELGSMIAGAQRRVIRTGFDLHDGPIQLVLVTALDLQTLRHELEELPAELARKPLEQVSTVHGRLVGLEAELRELSHSLDTPSWADVPLEESVRSELTKFEQESGIELLASIDGDFTQTSRSQRIALLRVVQGALSNVRHHSGATRVRLALAASSETIDLTVEDDGRGFVVHETVADAAGRGRLGIIAMGERVRLLGGEFDLDSRPGGPTKVTVSLRPLPSTEPV